MYEALYRKYRPLRFSDVIGQQHVTETLKRQVETGRTSHAYLFTGTRGTGKTTCAKILARAVNCENPQSGDPCNECPSCKDILSGANPDVIEIDAASNSGVDNIRSLRDESAYVPVGVKKRVYIIDEVHMLSIAAFNALLKTLEEPPAHVVFILATTEIHKVPATILSRCQRFSLKRIGRDDIKAQLLNNAAAEGIDLTPEAAALLAGLADGAMRDAQSLLDQCAGVSEGKVDTTAVYASVGMAGHIEAIKWVRDIAERKTGLVIQRFDRMLADGRDVTAMLDELSTLLRDVLVAHTMSRVPPLYALTLDEKSIEGLMALWQPARLLDAINILQDTQKMLAQSPSRRIAGEVCLIRLCDAVPLQEPVNAPVQTPEAPITATPATPVAPAESEKPQNSEQPGVPDCWAPLMLSMMGAFPTVVSAMQNAKPALKGNVLTLVTANEWEASQLSRGDVKESLQNRLYELEGKNISVVVKTQE